MGTARGHRPVEAMRRPRDQGSHGRRCLFQQLSPGWHGWSASCRAGLEGPRRGARRQALDQPVDLLGRRVDAEAGPRGGGTPSRSISGWAQWWPARTATPWRSRISETSWAWTPSSSKETGPRRSGPRGGPKTRRPGDLGEALERVVGDLALVRGDRLHAERRRASGAPRPCRSPGRSPACRPRSGRAGRRRSCPPWSPCGSSSRRRGTAASRAAGRAAPQRAPIPVGP